MTKHIIIIFVIMLKNSRNRIEASPEQFLTTLKAGEHGCIIFYIQRSYAKYTICFCEIWT
jgi:hypothetical protein